MTAAAEDASRPSRPLAKESIVGGYRGMQSYGLTSSSATRPLHRQMSLGRLAALSATRNFYRGLLQVPSRRFRVAVPGFELVAGLEEHLAGDRDGFGHVFGVLEPVLHVQAQAVV